ncbi:MAG: hypothetical protein SNJ71_00945 [Bacteroidales bacterium]
MDRQQHDRKEARTGNTGFASGGVTCKLGALCFYSSVVQVDSFVLRNPPERKARNRWQQWKKTKHTQYETDKYFNFWYYDLYQYYGK